MISCRTAVALYGSPDRWTLNRGALGLEGGREGGSDVGSEVGREVAEVDV